MNHEQINREIRSATGSSTNNQLWLDVLSEAVRKNYLTRLDEMPVVESPHFTDLEKDLIRNIRVFKITEMVYEKHESVTDKLATVYNTLTSTHASLFLLLDSDGTQTDFYLGVRNMEDEQSMQKRSTVSLRDTLRRALIGHFPGINIENITRKQIARLSSNIQKGETIAAVTLVASARMESSVSRSEQAFVQGLEKLALAMKGCAYTGLILAENQPNEEVAHTRKAFEEIYSRLYPYQWKTETTPSNEPAPNPLNFFAMSNEQKMNAIVQLAGSIFGSHPVAESNAAEAGVSQISGQLTRFVNGLIPNESSAGNNSASSAASIENKSVTEILKVLDQQMERCSNFETYGMWQTAAYFISDDLNTVEIAASNYRSLMSGSQSSLEVSAMNLWQKRLMEDPKSFDELITCLSRFVHPQFQYSQGVPVSAATAVSGKELALHLGLPRSSVPGLPVTEHAQFGKEVIRNSQDPNERLTLGKIFDWGQDSQKLVELNNQSLTMHTFITGSTGSGKSNAVYKMLTELRQDRIPFLVIEPAKGEYKDLFGHFEDVQVYSTNPDEAELLHLNPFQFPESIHVLEHVDGLVEIFSVCWPMYDAMPAFFKESILKAYKTVGWDLGTSTFEGEDKGKKYPDFQIVAKELDQLINNSEYAAEIKSNYRGALLTRVRSLTVGLNKYIFSSEQTPYSKLFDDNCILDFSRVKSQETKSFLMGLLVYLLNEYRMDQKQRSNDGLRHVTVLEEAHNILKNKAGSHSELTGKSVEILTNTIAEIRTYGEGFIIVDQSPSSVDLAAIKNTNTKIVLRTPEANDREAIGRSMGLNADQVDEIAKLPTGVAVVYQNNWLDPVLTHVEEVKMGGTPYVRPDPHRIRSERAARTELVCMLLQDRTLSKEEMLEDIRTLNLDASTEERLNLRRLAALMSPIKGGKGEDCLDDVSGLLEKLLGPKVNALAQSEVEEPLHDFLKQTLSKENMNDWNTAFKSIKNQFRRKGRTA